MRSAIVIAVFCLSTITLQAQTSTGDFVLGKVETLHSDILKEDRILNIYLPEGYNDSTLYPVIYLLDGGAGEDFIHIAGLIQYYNFPWINRVPPSIVVGIANTNRKRDFTFPSENGRYAKYVPGNGGSAAFISFIEKEIQPFIRNKYHTTEFKTLIGQSLGGLLASEILLTRPGLFSNYIIISPSLWWDNGSLLKKETHTLLTLMNSNTSVYIGVGKEGAIDGTQDHVMERDAKRLADKLQSLHAKELKVIFDFMPEENHATSSHPAVFNAFKFIYPQKGK